MVDIFGSKQAKTMEIMTSEQWVERDQKDAEIRHAQQLASGLPNALTWRKDQMNPASNRLEIDPQGMLTLTVNGLSSIASLEDWFALAKGVEIKPTVKAEPIKPLSIDDLPNPLKAAKLPQTPQTASV